MTHFLHGGHRREFARRYGVQESDILDFSSNGNPWGPPESVRRAYEESFPLLGVYPDPESSLLKKEVARHFPVWPENVIAGNGATELIYLVVQWLRPRTALLVEPSFLEYRRALNLHRVEVRELLLRETDGFQLSFPELMNAVRGMELVFLANPNNPTGVLLPKGEGAQFLEEMKRRGVFVVLDEAFIDWVPEASLASQIADNVSFLVIRSLTKFFNLPGIRIGYALGPRRLIERLEQCRVTWSVNTLAERLGVEALRDALFERVSRENMMREKEFLFESLSAIGVLKVYPGAANFFLVKLRGPIRVGELTGLLAKENVMIRDASNFSGLDHQYFRVSVRTRMENEILIGALKKVLEGVHV